MINLPDFDLYIFDLDDTLINTRQAYYSAQETAVSRVFPSFTGSELSGHLADLKWLCRTFGSGQPENYFAAFSQSLPEHLTSTEAASTIERLLKIYHENFDSNLKALNGASDYLRQLIDQNKSLALASNGKTNTQLRKLQLTRLNGFFPEDVCFISQMVPPTQKKPSPHLINQACANASIAPEHAVFFGNTASDILAGNLAGVTTVFFGDDTAWITEAPKIAHPDFQIPDWAD